VVHVQPNDLQVKLRMLFVPIRAWHIEMTQVVDVTVDLGTLGSVFIAHARVDVKVMVAIHSVPRDRAELWCIDIPPFRVPLPIPIVGHTTWIE
jgi:hypothetical protein